MQVWMEKHNFHTKTVVYLIYHPVVPVCILLKREAVYSFHQPHGFSQTLISKILCLGGLSMTLTGVLYRGLQDLKRRKFSLYHDRFTAKG